MSDIFGQSSRPTVTSTLGLFDVPILQSSTPAPSKYTRKGKEQFGVYGREFSLPPSSPVVDSSPEGSIDKHGFPTLEIFDSAKKLNSSDPFGFLAAEKKLKAKLLAQYKKPYLENCRAAASASFERTKRHEFLDSLLEELSDKILASSPNKEIRSLNQIERQPIELPFDSSVDMDSIGSSKLSKEKGKNNEQSTRKCSSNCAYDSPPRKLRNGPLTAIQNNYTRDTNVKQINNAKKKNLDKRKNFKLSSETMDETMDEEALMAITKNLEALLPNRPVRRHLAPRMKNMQKKSLLKNKFSRRKTKSKSSTRLRGICRREEGEGESYVLDDETREVSPIARSIFSRF